MYVKYRDKGLVILGFNASDDRKIALEMLRDNGAKFPNIIDSSTAATKVCFQEYQGRYGSAVPMNYIIDREGKVMDAWYGGGRDHPRAVAAMRKAGGQLAETVKRDQEEKVARDAKEATAAAKRLFDAIRTADYDHDWTKSDDWKWFPAKDVDYTVSRDPLGLVVWICKKFKANPIVDVQLGKPFAGSDGLPTVPYQLQLKDGEILKGALPFRWNPQTKQWVGYRGIDWHLQKKP
jgi:hypothetical protein